MMKKHYQATSGGCALFAALLLGTCSTCHGQVGANLTHTQIQSIGAFDDAQFILNVGDTLVGIHSLLFDISDITTARAQHIFAGTYDEKHTTTDGRFKVPDGMSMTFAETCTMSGSSSDIKGETSAKETTLTEVKFNAEGGYGPISGSLQNSNTFKSMSQETSKHSTTFFQTTMLCTLYQMQLETFHLPPHTENFMRGMINVLGNSVPATVEVGLEAQTGLRGSKSLSSESVVDSDLEATALWAAGSFVTSFGTHYQSKTSMGSRYTETHSSSKENRERLDSSGVNIEVALEATSLGNTVGASALSDSEKEQSSALESFVSTYHIQTIGAQIPAAETKEEARAEWSKNTRTSEGLAAVTGFEFVRIDALMQEKYLGRLNDDLKRYGLTAKGPTGTVTSDGSFTKEGLQVIRDAVGKAAESLCVSSKQMNCGEPAPDITIGQIEIKTSKTDKFGGSGGGEYVFDEALVAGLFGKSQLQYDVVPTTFRTWWRTDDNIQHMIGFQIVYHDKDGMGIFRESGIVGKTTQEQCDINVPQNERITQLTFAAGTLVDGIELKTDKTSLSPCGNMNGGIKHHLTFNDKEYLFGFWGTSGDWIDSIGAMIADEEFN